MLRGFVGVAALLGLAVTPAGAGEPTDTLRKFFDRANHILLSPAATDEGRRTALRALVGEAFDAREAAALALGPHWDARTTIEREEFSRLYADVLESAYLGRVGSRARVRGDGIRVAFESEVMQGPRATVVTTLETRGSGAVPVEYRMQRSERGWAVIDVAVDSWSLASSYRAQFQHILQNGTYADLVARLRDKASAVTLPAIAAAKRAVAGTPHATSSALAPVMLPPAAENAPTPVLVASAPFVSDAPPASRVARAIDLSPSRRAPAPTSLWLQVGAFRQTETASRLVESLRGYGVMVTTGGGRGAALARVLVGPFADRAAAALVVKELAARGHRAFIAVE